MKKIVVVDDQPVLASICRAKFVTEGFQVEIATDGEQALEVISRTALPHKSRCASDDHAGTEPLAVASG